MYGLRWGVNWGTLPGVLPTPLQLGELTVRERTPRRGGRDPTYRAELALALGPLVMGDPGNGSYGVLHATPWLLAWPKGGGLHLYQQQDDGWVEVQPGQAFPELPDTARRIALTFDQTARHVIAWEDQGQIVVRQWDQVTSAYVYRGAWPGVDPLLINDALLMFETTVSDVLLLYLSPDRLRLCYRIQNERYAIEHELSVLPARGVLDQVVAVPLQLQIAGGYETGEPWAFVSELYPAYLRDPLLAGIGPPLAGARVVTLIEAVLTEAVQAGIGPPRSGAVVDASFNGTLPREAFSSTLGAPRSGTFVLALQSTALPRETTSASVGAPRSGTLVIAQQTYTSSTETITASLGAPRGGTLVTV